MRGTETPLFSEEAVSTMPQSSAVSGVTVRRKLSTRRKLAYGSLCLVAFLLLGEAAVRVRAWIRYGHAGTSFTDDLLVEDPVTGLRIPQPGYQVKAAKVAFTINSLGFRGEEITLEKPPNTLRIACVGASTTFCGEVSSNEATWPHQLQERLQALYPDVRIQVINAGIPGYVASLSLKNLRLRVLPLQPDLVIYFTKLTMTSPPTRAIWPRSVGLSMPPKLMSRRWHGSSRLGACCSTWRIRMPGSCRDPVIGK